MPKNAHLDTTILVNMCLKKGTIKNVTKDALKRYSKTFLPVYAIKEMSSGPLKNIIWLYNKLVATNSYIKTLEAIKSIYMQRNKQALALDINIFYQESIASRTPKELIDKYGELAQEDSIKRDELKIFTEALIIKGWKSRRSLATYTTVELACFQDSPPTKNDRNNTYFIPSEDCKKNLFCSKAAYLRLKPTEIAAMRKALKDETKPENQKRRKALKKLEKIKRNEVTEWDCKDCRALGDAAIVGSCDPDCVILTTNISDHALLANALGLEVESP